MWRTTNQLRAFYSLYCKWMLSFDVSFQIRFRFKHHFTMWTRKISRTVNFLAMLSKSAICFKRCIAFWATIFSLIIILFQTLISKSLGVLFRMYSTNVHSQKLFNFEPFLAITTRKTVAVVDWSYMIPQAVSSFKRCRTVRTLELIVFMELGLVSCQQIGCWETISTSWARETTLNFWVFISNMAFQTFPSFVKPVAKIALCGLVAITKVSLQFLFHYEWFRAFFATKAVVKIISWCWAFRIKIPSLLLHFFLFGWWTFIFNQEIWILINILFLNSNDVSLSAF